MYYYEVAPTKIVRAGTDTFIYESDAQLAPGTIVTIPVGTRQQIGLVMHHVDRPSFTTKPISTVVETLPLPPALVATARWMSAYYATPLALVLSSLLPRGISKKRRASPPLASTAPIRAHMDIMPTPAQEEAVDIIAQSSHVTHLLHGVTGAGKTLVYKQLARRTIESGRSVLVLVPEIALTSQLVDDFLQDFPHQVLLAHSQQTEAMRHRTWQTALRADTPHIVIGPRSALFLPLQSIGLIVVDEMHEPSYKQEQSPRYSALRVATILATKHHAKVVFGSATPPVAEYYAADRAGVPIIALPDRAHSHATVPHTEIVDMTKRGNFRQHRFLSDSLLAHMHQTLDTDRQVLLFHNRRGSAALTICDNCGWTAVDPDTGTPLTLHADSHELIGHISGFRMAVPTMCPVCRHTDIIHKGIGTKLIETEVTRLFPNKKVVRFDGDSGSEHSVDSRYRELYDGGIDIIIGTQVIAKGIDLPHLETVGIIQADAGLALPDFTSHERTFQLITQVVGRVGRNDTPARVVVQTYQPTHPAVLHGINQDYTGFYTSEIAERRRYHFPPFSYLLKCIGTYKTEAAAVANARKLAHALRSQLASSERLLGPTPAFYEKQAGAYRWQITVHSPHRSHLIELVHTLPSGGHWQFEIDPVSLLS